jgi:peptidoglycan-associated lipoprotein
MKLAMKTIRNLASHRWLALAPLALLACGGEQSVMPPAATAPPESAPVTPRASVTPVPNSPTAANVTISEDIRRACRIPDAEAYFSFDSSAVTAKAKSPLDLVATCVTRGPLSGKSLRLIGHADPRGGPDYNMTLGQARADAVATFLTTMGVERAHTSTTSRGALDATGTNEATWAADRRVDITLND